MKNIFLLSCITLLFLTSCLPGGQGTESTPEPIPPIAPDQFNFESGLVPAYQHIVQEMDDASLYSIKFVIDDDLYHITGSEEVTYTNRETVDLNEIHLRLFANILGGEMIVQNTKVNGNDVTPNYSLNNSLLIIPLGTPLAPTERIILSMDFSIAGPQMVQQNYGVQAYYENVLALGHA